MAELENAGKEEQVNELDKEEPKDKEVTPTVLPKDAEPIDAPIQAPVDHGAIVQGYLSNPDSKLILRKDAAADNLIKNTKFKDNNTFLGAILSDIASRLISKDDNDDRVANFASRVADEMSQEKEPSFKATPDYMKNKKIAIQLAKRYMDDYRKMQKDPEFKDEVRKDPQEIKKFKNIKGKEYGDKSKEYRPKEEVAFESWVDETVNEYAKMGDYPRDKEIEKKDKENATKLDVTKADKMMNTTAYKRMQAGDERYADKTEGNQFAQAVQKAKAAGMKAGDKFKVGADEYTLKDAIEMAGLQLEDFYSEEEQAYDTQIDRIKNLAFYQ
jgi:hypothetical protein